MHTWQRMKYARQKNEMPVAGNETYLIKFVWGSHFKTHLAGNRNLCRHLLKDIIESGMD